MKRSRREFLTAALGSSAVVAVGARPPRFLLSAAAAAPRRRDDTVLVVVQLSGGNDGLNTIVPYADDAYARARPHLALGAADVLQIDDYCGFHPALRGFSELLDNQQLAIVQGVGYPDPNRSHFESMDIWHTCHRQKQRRQTGWLGRYLDATDVASASDVPALHFGGEKQPLALMGQRVRVPTVRSVEQFQLRVEAEPMRAVVRNLTRAERQQDNPLLGYVQTSTTSALAASRRFGNAWGDYVAQAEYPATGLAEKLHLVAQLIEAELGTRIYYVELDGFDTHAAQADAHAGLLRQLGDAVAAFIRDLSAHGHHERVVLMTFSEFGRRVAENASLGTDHGAAAPMLLAGSPVRPGLVGEHPSLTDLAGGDLRHHTDFRQVYATLLERWLGWDSGPVLDGDYELLPLL